MEAKIRREADTLFLSGLAVIVFGIWGMVKIFITYFLNPEAWVAPADVDQDTILVHAVIMGALIVLSLIEISLRLRIGLPAIAESRETGQGKRHYYLFLAVFYLIVDASSFFSIFIVPGGVVDVAENIDGLDRFTNIIIQATSCYVLLQLIVSSVKLRRLRRDAGLI